MKTMAAYIAKLQAENYGITQKVQNDSRSVTTGIYRGVPGCGSLNYQTIIYPRKLGCSKYCPPEIVKNIIYNGGTPSLSGPKTLNGGTPSTPGGTLLNGGAPQI